MRITLLFSRYSIVLTLLIAFATLGVHETQASLPSKSPKARRHKVEPTIDACFVLLDNVVAPYEINETGIANFREEFRVHFAFINERLEKIASRFLDKANALQYLQSRLRIRVENDAITAVWFQRDDGNFQRYTYIEERLGRLLNGGLNRGKGLFTDPSITVLESLVNEHFYQSVPEGNMSRLKRKPN